MFKGSARYLEGTAGEEGQIHLIFLQGVDVIQQQGAVAVVEETAGQQNLHFFFGREGQGCRQAGGDDGKREILRYHFHQLLDGGPGIQTYTAAGFQR